MEEYKRKELNVGEKYLKIKLDVGFLLKLSAKAISNGLDDVYIATYRNENYTEDGKQPLLLKN